MAAEYFPPRHTEQEPAVARLNVPPSQSSQSREHVAQLPHVGLCFPAAQLLQTEAPALTVSEPAAQMSHDGLPMDAWNFPSIQSVHFATPLDGSLYMPRSHCDLTETMG